jgi:tetratricopeptide (TPR) repeat protein
MRPTPSDLWPGAARIWQRGDFRGLVLAALFACALNVALLLAVVWPYWAPIEAKWASWLMVVTLWGAGGWESMKSRQAWQHAVDQDPQLDLFLAARAEYLKGNRTEAERCLVQLLQSNDQDIEARLLLATLYRHAQRWDDAKEQLRRLQRWRNAARWNMEIRREWERISKAEAERVLEDQPSVPARPGFVRSRANRGDSAINKAA